MNADQYRVIGRIDIGRVTGKLLPFFAIGNLPAITAYFPYIALWRDRPAAPRFKRNPAHYPIDGIVGPR
jgi:hypothetical protein